MGRNLPVAIIRADGFGGNLQCLGQPSPRRGRKTSQIPLAVSAPPSHSYMMPAVCMQTPMRRCWRTIHDSSSLLLAVLLPVL
ncbi:hypothetical protein VTN96DRAFT_2956 [Rasamsonia emersonii]